MRRSKLKYPDLPQPRDGFLDGKRNGFWWAIDPVYLAINADVHKRGREAVVYSIDERPEENAEMVYCEKGRVYQMTFSHEGFKKFVPKLSEDSRTNWHFIQPVLHPWQTHTECVRFRIQLQEYWREQAECRARRQAKKGKR